MLTNEVLADPVELTRALVDVESVSHNEAELTDAIEAALSKAAHLKVERFGNTVVARTELGRAERVVLAGHTDTVPLAGNFPSTVDGDLMYGCGTSDMKSGTALALHLAATMPDTRFDVTYVFYDCEEIEAVHNGLNKLVNSQPALLTDARFAILLEPTYGLVEAGCQGTMRERVRTPGERAHSARSWLGVNAIHAMGDVLRVLQAYEPRKVTVDGCTYNEGMNAVRIGGGVAGNVIPDDCWVEVNYRFAPDRSEQEAADHLRERFPGHSIVVFDSAPACPCRASRAGRTSRGSGCSAYRR